MNFQDIVYRQKHLLRKKLKESMISCGDEIMDKITTGEGDIEETMITFAKDYSISGRMYFLDEKMIQISSDIYIDKIDSNFDSKELDKKIYASDTDSRFYISNTYISHRNLRPTVSAVNTLVGEDDSLLGYLVLDILVRNIGDDNPTVDKKSMQLKGDPAIRENIFNSIRKQSEMDKNIDVVHAISSELVRNQGIFHIKLHYSSSRSTVWEYSNPYEYVVHTIDEILTPDICLMYKEFGYPKEATVKQADIPRILEKFKYLRFMDDNIYLRAGSINIMNGKVGLNFSCDGSHYLCANEFLEIASSEYGV